MYRRKFGVKILTGKILDEFFTTYRKNFVEKILVGKILAEKILIGNFPDGFVLDVQRFPGSNQVLESRCSTLAVQYLILLCRITERRLGRA